MLRVDTVTVNNNRAYEADTTFFERNPNRRIYIREAFDDEFTSPINITDFLQIPALQVIVIKLGEGMHLVAFVYYGRKFVNLPVKSDTDVAQILTQMQRHIGGYADDEWKHFIEKALDNQQAIEATVNNAAKRIH